MASAVVRAAKGNEKQEVQPVNKVQLPSRLWSWLSIRVNEVREREAETEKYLVVYNALRPRCGLPQKGTNFLVPLFREAADGRKEAQALLGVCYLDGMGVTLSQKTRVRAQDWLERSAANFCGTAELVLAYCYHTGIFPTQNRIEKARKMAERGKLHLDESDPIGQCYLGLCYLNGICVIRNLDEALSRFNTSAMCEYWGGQHWLGMFYLDNGRTDLAVESLLLAAEQGYAEAQYWMYQCYKEKDPRVAYYWLETAFEQGHQEAAEEIESLR